MEEYWDVYDKDRIFQNKTIRPGDPFAEREYYVCCDVWFKNSKGELLVTQRHPNKKAGGLWEFVGGGVLAGETTAQAAVREVKEEIGITITENDLTLLHVFQQKNHFMDVYLVKKDVNIDSITLGIDETIDAKWVSEDGLRDMIDKQIVVRSVVQRYETLKDKL